MPGRGENQLQTVINTIGCARHGSLTSLACRMCVNWMWRVLWKAPSAASMFTKTPRVLMGTESPSLNKSLWQSPDSTVITPQENTTNSPTFWRIIIIKKEMETRLWCVVEICETVDNDSSDSRNRCLKLACLWESTFANCSHNTFSKNINILLHTVKDKHGEPYEIILTYL